MATKIMGLVVYNVTWPTSVPSGILIHPAVWPQQTWAKNWGFCAHLGELDPHLTECGRAEA